MALSVSHPVSTRDTNIIPRAIRDVIRKEPYHIMFIIYLNMSKSCSVLWTFRHVINIILRGMIKGWWYRYQSRQTNTVVMFFRYYICKFPLFSTKYMIKRDILYVILNIQIYYLNFIIMRVLVRNNHYFTNVYRGGSRIYTQTEYKQYWRNFTMDSVCPTYCYIYQDNRCLWCLTTLSTILQLYCGVGNRSATRKPPICRKSLTNFIT